MRGLPFSGNGGSVTYNVPGQTPPPPGQELKTLENAIDPNYLATVGLPLIRGRNFTQQDGPDSPPVMLVNRNMAEKLWPGEDPLGKQVELPEAKVTASVVGVVGDAKQYDIGEPQRPQIYTAYAQNPHIFGTLVVRARVEPLSLAESVKKTVWSVDPEQPVWKVRSMETLLAGARGPARALSILIAIFAAVALMLAAVGIYGVMTYLVAQRTREIGIRMALGASARTVVAMVVGRGLALTLAATLLGIAGAAALTRTLATLLFGVGPLDPLTFAAAAALLGGVALLACYLPARRAARVDPVVALAEE